MEQLWAPWRLAYVAAAKKPEPEDPCFICRGLEQDNDRENLIVQRRRHSVVLLNRFPYNNGHLLIGPLRHIGDLSALSDEESLDISHALDEMVSALTELMHPDGFNLGVNLGRTAGAGLPGHLHWHVVPRWEGDTNFMPVLTDTKVIVQSLDALYTLLKDHLNG